MNTFITYWTFALACVGLGLITFFLVAFIIKCGSSMLEVLNARYERLSAGTWLYRAAREYAKTNPLPNRRSKIKDPESAIREHTHDLLKLAEESNFRVTITPSATHPDLLVTEIKPKEGS